MQKSIASVLRLPGHGSLLGQWAWPTRSYDLWTVESPCSSTKKGCAGLWALSCDFICPKLQTLVYDFLPSTTAVFSYAIGSRKLSANEQFFVGAQTVAGLLQTTQIILSCCFTSTEARWPIRDGDRVGRGRQGDSNKTRRVIYSRQQSLHQHK